MSTYTPIASQTLGGSATTVTFSSLPQNYTDLIIVYNATSSTDDQNYIQFNNDTGTNYSRTFITGNGSSAVSSRSSNDTKLYGPFSVSVPTVNTIQIQNYSNSATYKTTLIRSGAANNSTIATVGSWRSTSAITSVLIGTNSGTFNSGTVFTIYGIAAGNSSAKATGGNIVVTDGSYWYHAFTSSGVFIPSQALTCDYLVVAGGGGGGGNTGGGDGAGGYRTSSGGSTLSLSANTVYQALIGAGGVGGIASIPSRGSNGGNSTFSTISATGGGGGGASGTNQGISGGSGGGAARGGQGNYSGGAGNAGSYSPVEGYAGGDNGPSSPGGNSGGGGGAGGAGVNASAYNSGAGGIGATTSLINAIGSATGLGQISSGNYYFAGGGGGGSYNGSAGSGGLGGGGAGSPDNSSGSNALVNTGGGGGGGNNNGSSSGANNGYAGGSGIIVIRYAV